MSEQAFLLASDSHRIGRIMDCTATSPIEGIRQAIRESLAQLGCDTAELHEAILIRGGMYCGRRFECAEGSAVWFLEENQIKYFNADGGLLKVVRLPQITTRRAA
jgi:hypothetical protein